MPKIINHIQGSDLWLAWRRTKITASMAGPIMSLSDYMTPLQLYNQILEGSEEPDNHFMAHGRNTEDEARQWANERLCRDSTTYIPLCAESTTYTWMGASLDGWNENAEVKGMEIKSPKKRIEQFALLDTITPSHFAQIQHQISVMDVEKWYYVTYSKESQDGVIITVKRDDLFIKKMIEAENAFRLRLVNFDPPDPIDGRDIETLDDPALYKEIEEYVSIHKQFKHFEKLEKELKTKVLAKIEAKSVFVGNFKIMKSIKQGRVDYESIPCLQGYDLDQHRKPNQVSWRIS